jgi:SAM-dependent methyltransferase
MKFRKFLFTAIISGLIPFSVFAQNENEPPVFVPYEGQAGKDVIWVPTPLALVNALLDKARVGPGDILVDLGSGDGRFVIEAARRGAMATGIEFNPEMVSLSVQKAKKEGLSDKAKFLNMDLFDYDLSNATVVSMYLLSELNLRLRPKLLDLKPGTRIVSNTFNLGTWMPDAEIHPNLNKAIGNDESESSYFDYSIGYFWIVPSKIEGTWEFRDGHLNIDQNFQLFHGNYIDKGKLYRIEEGKLAGSEISFTIGGVSYIGKVYDGQMDGSYFDGSSNISWHGKRISNK